jgi:aminoglycoside phosphotransferase family enzyme/predicted kinase
MEAECDTREREAALPPPIAAMTDPAFYPERPRSVELKQTHISYLFLAGDYVYKVKKPVRFAFLDASCLRTRRELCESEIVLNRRLAPNIYLGVVPIVRTSGGYALGGPGQMHAAEEFAVKMRRLDESRMLDVLVKNGTATPAMMRAVAERVAQFHAHTPAKCGWRYGSAAAVWQRVIGDLVSYEQFIGYTISGRELAEIEAFCRNFIETRWGFINQRASEGRVRDCHGDLRAEQICMDRELNIFDCIEFSERLRYCDVASEAAFLAMDLDRLGAPCLAQEFVSSYSEISADAGLASMLPMYKCYRASIRAMAESLRSTQPEIAEKERAAAKTAAEVYFSLAHRYATLARPALIAICGSSGTGKSTLARSLRERIGFEIVNSDVTRKRIAGNSANSRSHGYNEGIYAVEFTRKTYQAMMQEAAVILDSGRGVILDATFRDPVHRRPVLECAAAKNLPLAFVECRCDEREVLRRLNERTKRGPDASDATAEVYLRQRGEFVPLDEIQPEQRIVADTNAHPIEAALAVEKQLERLLAGRSNHNQQ